MKHTDFLNPYHIILSNKKTSASYKEFTKNMRSRKFTDLRLLEAKSQFYIRYQIDGDFFWYGSNILQIKGKDYYIELNTLPTEVVNELEKKYIRLNREEKLNKLFI